MYTLFVSFQKTGFFLYKKYYKAQKDYKDSLLVFDIFHRFVAELPHHFSSSLTFIHNHSNGGWNQNNFREIISKFAEEDITKDLANYGSCTVISIVKQNFVKSTYKSKLQKISEVFERFQFFVVQRKLSSHSPDAQNCIQTVFFLYILVCTTVLVLYVDYKKAKAK